MADFRITRRRPTRLRLGAVCAAATSLWTGCFLVQATAGQLSLINDQVPLPQAVAQTSDDDQRRMLMWVPEILSFARDVMAMDAGQSYRGFVQLQGPGLTHVLVAAEKTQLVAYKWWFPLAGSVEYKSFFSEADARREAEVLHRKGYDTYVGPSRAYSTLGYLRDPVTSAMMNGGFLEFVEVLLHELAHRRLYVAGETDFNEQLASFVGQQGTLQFLNLPRFSGSGLREAWQARRAADQEFQQAVEQAAQALRALYGSGLNEDGKLAARMRVFAALERARPKTTGDRESPPINNAVLLHYLRYSHDAPHIRALWTETCAGNWHCFWHATASYADRRF